MFQISRDERLMVFERGGAVDVPVSARKEPGNMSMPTTDPAPGPQRGLVFLSCLALITGFVTGFGAVFFRGVDRLLHNLMFLGKLSFMLRRQRVHAAEPVGGAGHPGAGRSAASGSLRWSRISRRRRAATACRR